MKEKKIAIIGLGYVGLPLALEFSKHYPVIGFDINASRVEELSRGEDSTLETDTSSLKAALKISTNKGLFFTDKAEDIAACNIYIVTVPTPINKFNSPDLTPLQKASSTIGQILKKDDIVIYESTTYPGCTEEVCVPILEDKSQLKFNQDFFVGYSPERINPGDKVNTLTKIKKVTSGSTPEIADVVNELYQTIITVGTHKAPSIKVAEASKIIENAQRDVNISFVNELALIFDKIGIDTNDVLDAAGSKWNFLKYQPGLVGGHCISVDPYYLASKAESVGYVPQVILSGRNVNNSIATFVANKVMKLMVQKDHKIKGSNILLLGITFKENCPDIRNSKSADVYNELIEFGANVDVYDPWANEDEVMQEFRIPLLKELNDKKQYHAIILVVAHEQNMKIDFEKYFNLGAVIYDCKNVIPRQWVDGRL